MLPIEGIRAYFNGLLERTRDGELIQNKEDVDMVKDNNQLKEVLSHHYDGEARFERLTGFSVGCHPFHKARCFFVVEGNEDNAIYFFRDFSIRKPLSRLAFACSQYDGCDA